MFLDDCIQQTKVLILESRKAEEKEIQGHLLPYNIVPQFYRVKGVQNKLNNGKGELSVSQIMAHNAPDEISNDIYLNHIGMIQEAYNQGLDRVLFLEEDARFEVSIDKTQLKNIQEFLKKQDWDIFYLGYCPWPYVITFPVSQNIVRIPSPLLAHAYILSRSGMEKVLQYHETKVLPTKQFCHFDKVLTEISMKKMGTYPSICFQKKDPGLFKEVKKTMKLPFHFRAVCRFLEHLALLWPILMVLVVAFLLVRRFLRKKKKTVVL